MSKIHAVCVVFFTGVSVTALEIAAARIVSPFFGSTVYVWGGSIGTVLLALALGYWLGGKVIDRYPSKRLVGIVLMSAAIAAGMIPVVYRYIFLTLQHWTIEFHIPVALTVMISMISLFLVPLVGMGMISPIVLRLSLLNIQSAGSWSGLLSGASTVGSILGTFISAYATIPLFGTRATILGASTLLVLLAIPYIRSFIAIGIIACIATSGYIAQAKPLVERPGLLWSIESPYQFIQVATDGTKRYLYHDTATGAQSIYVPGSAYSQTLYDAFGLLPYLVDNGTKERSVLVIGLAGATSVRPYVQALANYFDFSITGVEIDPQVIVAAKKYFDIDDLGIRIVNDDARYFLDTTTKKYDIIIVDAYTNELVIPPMLATKEFYQQLQDHLNPGGVVGMNAAALPASRYYEKLIATLASVFPDVRHAPFKENASNHLVLASKAMHFVGLSDSMPLILQGWRDQIVPAMVRAHSVGPIYTDNQTDLDIRVRPFID